MRAFWTFFGYIYYPAELKREEASKVEVAIRLKHMIMVSEGGTVETKRVYSDQVPLFNIHSEELLFQTRGDIDDHGENLGPQRELATTAIDAGYTIFVSRTGCVDYIPAARDLPDRPPVTCLSDLISS